MDVRLVPKVLSKQHTTEINSPQADWGHTVDRLRPELVAFENLFRFSSSLVRGNL